MFEHPLKIGILGTRGIPNAYGGFEQFAQYLAEGMKNKGHLVWVYNSHNHPYRQPEWKGVSIIHCNDPEHKIGTPGQFLYDLNCLKDARKRNFDILLQLGYTSSSIWYWLWPRKAINIVNMDGLEWKRSKYGKATRKFLKLAEKLAARHASLLVADSLGIKQHLASSYQKDSVFIPYGAELVEDANPDLLKAFGLHSGEYYLLIARMEPENNIELIILGYLASEKKFPLVLAGNYKNKYGTYLRQNYRDDSIIFIGAIYEVPMVNALRFHSLIYFHGHSVGGTNPSLLEAMGCGCNIAAHNNIFNRSVLEGGAEYFSDPSDIGRIINQDPDINILEQRKYRNLEKIKSVYNWNRIIDEYENLFLKAYSEKL